MPNDYSWNSAARRKAKTLNAVDAYSLMGMSLPIVLSFLTESQILRVQKVLDAAVVDPVVKKEAEELYHRSVTHQAGSAYTVDEKTERRGDRVMDGMIWVKEDDKHIRLDFEMLLTKDALEPTTDNPDEAEYLKKVKNTLKGKGIWLRVTQRSPVDPRSFEVWLSLGYGGNVIPSKLGLLDRDALLGNQLLGANYYEEVTQGKVQKTLENQISLLELDIDEGEREHSRLISRYDDAFPGVAELSDAIGGANLPGQSIWKTSKSLMSKASDLRIKGDVMATQACLLLAAIAVNKAAQLLSTYAERSSAGAGSIVKVLEVAKTAGEIAEIGLAITGVIGVGRGIVVRAGGGVSADGELAQRWLDAWLKSSKNPGLTDAELSLARPGMSQGKTTLGAGAKAGQSSGAGTGFDKGWK